MNKNINAFKKLIERYENITLDEITDKWDEYTSQWDDDYSDGEAIAGILTGYSKTSKCLLCIEAKYMFLSDGLSSDKDYCSKCVICINDNETHMCTSPLFENDRTFNDIGDANSPEELFKAYKNRAYALREFYKLNYGESL